MIKRYWQGGINELIKRVLNGKRTIRQAINFVENNYTGESRKAFRHKAFETTSGDTTIELQFLQMLKDALKLGHGEDKTFEIVFR